MSANDYISERAFAQAVVEAAEDLGWTVWRTWASVHSPSGEPDLRMVHPVLRQVIWAELKTQNGKLSPAQQESIDTLKAAGARVYVWRPADWPQIERVLAGKEIVV